jgi:hypothetical protein
MVFVLATDGVNLLLMGTITGDTFLLVQQTLGFSLLLRNTKALLGRLILNTQALQLIVIALGGRFDRGEGRVGIGLERRRRKAGTNGRVRAGRRKFASAKEFDGRRRKSGRLRFR